MEVFGHLGFALEDATPMFEITLTELAQMSACGTPQDLTRPPA